jgi:hypothetical protein
MALMLGLLMGSGSESVWLEVIVAYIEMQSKHLLGRAEESHDNF